MSLEGDRRLPRICMVTETYYPVVGGGERQAQLLASDLVVRGLEVMIVTRRTDPTLAETDRVEGVPVFRISPVGAGRARRWLMTLSSLRFLVRTRSQYDVIFVSGFKALGLSAVLAAKMFGKACILKADSNGEMSGEFFSAGLRAFRLTPASRGFRAVLHARNWVLRQADRFVAITSGIAEELRGSGVSGAVIHHITNGVDASRFHPVHAELKHSLKQRLHLPEKDLLIAYTGRLVTYKGLPLLLRVAEEILRERDNVGFVLIGSGGLDIHNCEAELREFVRARGLEESIHFAGDVNNVQEYLQASDIFVLPTHDDAFPLALVEAMACGLPPVATAVGGIREIVTHDHNGLLVAAGDRQQLYQALGELIADKSRSAALGHVAMETVRAKYAREIVAAKYVELFQAACS